MKPDTVPAGGELVPSANYPLTVDDLLALPEGNGWRYELHRGRLMRKPVAGGSHDYITYRLVMALGPYVEAHGLGAITLSQAGYEVTQPGEEPTVYIPDLAFVRADRVPPQGSPEWNLPWKLAPDLVVEVASPSQYKPEMGQRAQAWVGVGAQLVWVIWPTSQSVDVWSAPLSPKRRAPAMVTLTASDTLDGLHVIPGFSCPVADLFKGAHREA